MSISLAQSEFGKTIFVSVYNCNNAPKIRLYDFFKKKKFLEMRQKYCNHHVYF